MHIRVVRLSGGAYDYIWTMIEEFAYELRRPKDHKYERGFLHQFFMIAAKIAYETEKFDSGDYGEEAWLRINDLLKNLKSMLDTYLEVVG